MSSCRSPRRICCLPIAGPQNPYQNLMMEGLREAGHEVLHGAAGRMLAVTRTVLRFRPDTLHFDWLERYYLHRSSALTRAHGWLFLLEVATARYLGGVRIVWTMHNLLPHDRSDRRGTEAVRRRFARLCDWIRVFHPSTVERATSVLDVPRDRFRVVPEGSYVGHYPDGATREESRARLGLESTAFVLLFAGSIRPYKGLDELVDAFERVAEPDWKLVLAGPAHDAGYASRLRARVAGDPAVEIRLEFVPEEELQYYFGASDIVVLPFTRIENSGSVILAMGFGKPVVAPARGVLAERLRRQPELLYEDGLENGLRRLASADPETLERLGAANREEVERYRWRDFGALFGAGGDGGE